ncbi:hypothetical protein M901_0764 [Bacteriovorax sp. DB6_IX]|nr:hypothetical protein M901_0764 [Bacteriovorax sp. DB6_IX]
MIGFLYKLGTPKGAKTDILKPIIILDIYEEIKAIVSFRPSLGII